VKCERIRELVSDAIDGVLAPGAADRFHAHLDRCPPCRTYYMELKESLLLLEELPTVEVGDDFDRGVWARIRSEEEPRTLTAALGERLEMLRVRFSFGTGLLRWSPAVAAAVILLVVAMTAPRPDGGNASASDTARVAPSRTDTGVQVAEASNPEGPSSPRPGSPADLDAAEPSSGFQEQEYVSGMPRAVEQFLENGRDLRLPNPERYERSNYSYPLRQIPDPGLSDFRSQGRASGLPWQGGAAAVGTPVGATAPVGSPEGTARVMVLEF
jgi:Putative zinc-finger